VNANLAIAAALAFVIGALHSYLGERYIVQPILRRADLPRLMHTDWFFQRTVRYAWHLTTLLAWSLGALLFYYSRATKDVIALEIVSVTFVIAAVYLAIVSRGKHFAWPVFVVIGLLVWFF
jgi:branched-subunit amino acid ABC-type transport system permease component